jgi:hypothetical protein
MPTPFEVVALAAKIHGYGTKATSLLRSRGAEGRFLAKRDEILDEWFVELVRSVNDAVLRLSVLEQGEVRQRLLEDDAGMAILSNYCSEAHEEPLSERRRMLQFAAASLANLDLTLPSLARVQRILRELDANDILVLYGLWLVPSRQPSSETRENFRVGTSDTLRFALWSTSDSDALLASGCLRTNAVPTPSGAFFSSASDQGTQDNFVREQAHVTPTGILVLRALKPYILARNPSWSHIPGHEVTNEFRTEGEARRQIAKHPEFSGVLGRGRRAGFGTAQYDSPGIADGAPPTGKAQLLLRINTDGLTVPQLSNVNLHAQLQDPVSQLALERVSPHDRGIELQLTGPHDILRFLAYDVDALWT